MALSGPPSLASDATKPLTQAVPAARPFLRSASSFRLMRGLTNAPAVQPNVLSHMRFLYPSASLAHSVTCLRFSSTRRIETSSTT